MLYPSYLQQLAYLFRSGKLRLSLRPLSRVLAHEQEVCEIHDGPGEGVIIRTRQAAAEKSEIPNETT